MTFQPDFPQTWPLRATFPQIFHFKINHLVCCTQTLVCQLTKVGFYLLKALLAWRDHRKICFIVHTGKMYLWITLGCNKLPMIFRPNLDFISDSDTTKDVFWGWQRSPDAKYIKDRHLVIWLSSNRSNMSSRTMKYPMFLWKWFWAGLKTKKSDKTNCWEINVVGKWMSHKMDTNGSLCFNTAAGCIFRHQLVQFHNRTDPKAQWAVRSTLWQHKCHNIFPFNCIVFYLRPAARSGTKAKNCGRAHLLRTVSGCWTVHFFTPDSLRRKISSSKAKLHWRSPEQVCERLYSSWEPQSVSSPWGWYATVSDQKHCFS